jgi:hypothetical protein
MQPVILRWLVQNARNDGQPNRVCCSLQALGPVFTPQPNAVTTVNVNLPVTIETLPGPDETRAAAFDQLALSVLDGTTPVPLFDTGVHGGATQPISPVFNNAFFPAYSEPTVAPRASGGGSAVGGYIVMMQGELVPAGGASPGAGGATPGATPGPGPGAGPGAAPAPVAPAVPAPGLPVVAVPVRGDVAPVVVACGGSAECVGRVLLAARRPVAARARAARSVVYGQASFRIGAGKRAAVRVRLTAAGRALVARRRTAPVWAQVSVNGAAPVVRRLTLRR